VAVGDLATYADQTGRHGLPGEGAEDRKIASFYQDEYGLDSHLGGGA
jgi:hypothetical protein